MISKMYCVEQDTFDAQGKKRGTMKFWTTNEEKARAEATKGDGRRLRIVEGDAIPEAVRANAEQALQA